MEDYNLAVSLDPLRVPKQCPWCGEWCVSGKTVRGKSALFNEETQVIHWATCAERHEAKRSQKRWKRRKTN